MAQNNNVTLYFIDSKKPTAVDLAREALIPGIVRFRNVDQVGTNFEASDFVTAAPGVTIPAAYDAVARYSPEKPLSLEIVPNNPTTDLSNLDLIGFRAIARYSDGTAVDVTVLCAWVSATGATGTIGAATGIFTPVGVGTSVITATYNWAAEGEPGVVFASKALTAAAQVTANDTVGIGGVTYTFKAAVTTVANEILIGATKEESLENLKSAVNLEPNTGQYGTLTVVNPNARVTLAGAVLTAISKVPGTPGNSVAVAESAAQLSWAGGATALSGGANATAAVADTTLATVVA